LAAVCRSDSPDSAPDRSLSTPASEQVNRLSEDFARALGVSPLPDGSGKTDGRHRLNTGGNRDANNALWRIRVEAKSGMGGLTCSNSS
jgi:hypothetical protein